MEDANHGDAVDRDAEVNHMPPYAAAPVPLTNVFACRR
jgi:hypothetical protein